MVTERDAVADDRCFFCSRPLRADEPAQPFMGLNVHPGCYQAEVDSPSGSGSRVRALSGPSAEPSYLFVPVRPLKNAFAVELGRRGGLKGGRARAEKLSPSRRREIARRAARARWDGGRARRSA